MYTKKMQNHTLIYLLLSDLGYDEFSPKRYGRNAKIADFSLLFHSALMDFCRIKNRRAGGVSAYGFISFLHTSFCCLINGQILNLE